nr:synaptobrevin, longin-like domain protein [Tanacetum cinerariifolium]
MITILEKYEHNQDFPQIVDFVRASHIRIETTDEGTKILATGEGSGTPNESHHTPTSEASQSSQHELPSPSLPPVTTVTIPPVIPTSPLHTGSMQQNLDELTALCTSLQRQQSEMVSKFEAQELEINRLKDRIKLLEDKDRGVADQSGDDAPIKGRRIETTDEGTKILATVDGNLPTMSESSIRKNLKLNDEACISSLPDAELFENLQLIRYNILPNQKFTFQKGWFSHQWKYLIHTIMQCLSPKSTGFNEFSSNIATALICLASNGVYNFSKMIFDDMGEGSGTPTVSHHTPTSEASQSSQHELPSPSLPPVTTATIPPVIPTSPLPTSSALPPVADEPASPIRDDSQGEACPTDSSLAADPYRANIAKTSTLPSDSAPRVTSLAADEGSMQQKLDELTALCTSLQRQQSEMVSRFEAQVLEINSLKAIIKLLEDKDKGVADQSGDDAPIKGRRLDEGEEAAERVSDDTKEMKTVLTSMDAASILTSGGVQVVPTAAEVATATVSIPTGSGVVSTASPIIPTVALIFTTAIESTPYTRRKGKEKMVESDTPKKKKLQEQLDVQVARELEEKMAREDQRMSEQIARDAEVARIHAEKELQMMINSLDRSNDTVVKYLREYEQIPKDLSIGERIELISDLIKYQENYAQVFKYQTLQRKPRSKKQKKDYYMVIEEFIPMGSKEEAKRLKRKGLRLKQENVKKLKTLEEVPEEVKSPEEVPEEKVKEMMQLVPIEETHTQNMIHALVEWKLYDTCGVHHVTSKDKEIFMLVEKDYPLRKGLAIGMISYKLQGRIAGNKMHKEFLLPVMEFQLLEEVPTASGESSHCQKKRDATAEKIALLLNSSSNGRLGYEIQSSFALITSNDQGFTVDRNMDDFLVTENFGTILGQTVHTDDNVETTEFNRHEINFKSIEAKDKDMKLLSAPESNSILAKCLEVVTFPLMLRGNPPMKASRSFSEFDTIVGHQVANSWNLIMYVLRSFPSQSDGKNRLPSFGSQSKDSTSLSEVS